MTSPQREVLTAADKFGEPFTPVELARACEVPVTQIGAALGPLAVKGTVRMLPPAPEGGARRYEVTDFGRAEMERWEKYGRCEAEQAFRASMIRKARMGVPFPGSRGVRR